MAFFDKLAKTVGKGLDQASFEAEKLVRVNKMKSELGALRKELLEVKGVLADQVLAQYDAGSLAVPELEEGINSVKVLLERIGVQEQDLTAAQAETYEAKEKTVEPEPGLVKLQEADAEMELPSTSFCAECGNELPAGAAFCANCGAKVEVEQEAEAPEETEPEA